MTGFSRSNLKYMRAFGADSELVRDAIKDPYHFEFLRLGAEAKERDLEIALLNDVQSFLMEMGQGFALDLLFYNFILRRFVVMILCPGRNKTVTEWALRGIGSPVAVARYVTGDLAFTAEAPSELKPALPDLPNLAVELTQMVETAEIVYSGALDTEDDLVE
jgi:hypothetical protein